MEDFKILLKSKDLYPLGTMPIAYWRSMDYVIDEDYDLDDILYKSELRDALDFVLMSLSPKEEKVLRMRFGYGERGVHTYAEIGFDLDLSKSRIQQIEIRALGKLRGKGRRRRLIPFLTT